MPIVIDVKVRLGQTMTQMSALKRNVDSINRAVLTLNQNLANTAKAAQAAASAMSGAARGVTGGGGVRSRGAINVPRPPMANPQQGMQAYAQAAAQGNVNAQRLFNQSYQRNQTNQRAQRRAQQYLTFGNLAGGLGNALQGAGGIIGDLATMIPVVGKIIGPIIKAITAIYAAAIGAFAAALDVATRGLMGFYHTMVAGGGGPGLARAAATTGAAIGVDLAGVGQNLSPIAASAIGVSPFTGPFGNMDYNQRGLQAFNWVNNASSFEGARRRAALAGAPDLAAGYLLDPSIKKAITSQNQGQSGETSMRNAVNFSASLVLIKNALMDIASPLVIPAMKALAVSFTFVADAVKRADPKVLLIIGAAIASVVSGIVQALYVFMKGLYNFFEFIIKIWNYFHGKGFQSDDWKKSVDKFSNSVDNFGNAVGKAQGVFGGGSRAGSAVGSGMNPSYGYGPGKFRPQYAPVGVL